MFSVSELWGTQATSDPRAVIAQNRGVKVAFATKKRAGWTNLL
jgi:hypothetical protein